MKIYYYRVLRDCVSIHCAPSPNFLCKCDTHISLQEAGTHSNWNVICLKKKKRQFQPNRVLFDEGHFDLKLIIDFSVVGANSNKRCPERY